jgi:septal ring factor EnvC (AmiA/AmiB activator)
VESKVYTAKNRSDAERVLLVEHPVRNDFKLKGDVKPAETASDVYRFEVKVPAGATKTLTVTEERTLASAVQLSSTSDEQVRWFLAQAVTSDKVKKGLREALRLRHELAKTQRDIAELQRQLSTITEDQKRLRANLREMPPTAKAYKRYLEKFDDQESQIEKYQADVKKLQGVEHSQKKEFDDFLVAFSAE